MALHELFMVHAWENYRFGKFANNFYEVLHQKNCLLKTAEELNYFIGVMGNGQRQRELNSTISGGPSMEVAYAGAVPYDDCNATSMSAGN